jgi:hypothetical protein
MLFESFSYYTGTERPTRNFDKKDEDNSTRTTRQWSTKSASRLITFGIMFYGTLKPALSFSTHRSTTTSFNIMDEFISHHRHQLRELRVRENTRRREWGDASHLRSKSRWLLPLASSVSSSTKEVITTEETLPPLAQRTEIVTVQSQTLAQQVLEAIRGKSAVLGRRYAEQFGLDGNDNDNDDNEDDSQTITCASLFALLDAMKRTVAMGLHGYPLVLRKADLEQVLLGNSQREKLMFQGFFTMKDLEKAVEDDFLDAARGSTDNRKGWKVRPNCKVWPDQNLFWSLLP